jgi:hypothetical protein
MVEETVVNPPSSSANQIKKLKSEIGNLRGRFSEIKKQVEQKTKYLKYGSTGEVPNKPFYILIKRKSGDWFLFGKYNTEQEYKDAINKIKSEKGKRHSNIVDYYVTYSEKEVERFLKVSRYKEKQYHEKIQKEISRLPTNRWTENLKTGIQLEDPKEVTKSLGRYSGYDSRGRGLPKMGVAMWGSMLQPKKTERLPVIGESERTKPRKQKIILPHEQYQSYLDSGYTKKQLTELGIFSKRSDFFTESSPFPNAISYKPVGYYQSFVHINPPLTEYQKRIAEGRPYEPFRPKRISL